MNTCRSCKYWNQPEWWLSYSKYTKREDNITGWCTWKPDMDKIPHYLQYQYKGGRWDGAVQHRDQEACGCFEEKE